MWLEEILEWEYDRETRNCAHFTGAIWKHETGVDITSLLLPLINNACVESLRKLNEKFKRLNRLPKRRELALAWMKSGKEDNHVGVYVRGRIAHFTEAHGAMFEDPEIAMLVFKQVRFYR